LDLYGTVDAAIQKSFSKDLKAYNQANQVEL